MFIVECLESIIHQLDDYPSLGQKTIPFGMVVMERISMRIVHCVKKAPNLAQR